MSPSVTETTPPTSRTKDRPSTPPCLHVCVCQGLSITVGKVFAKARSICRYVCPDQNFLRLSEVMEDIANEAKVGRTEEEDHNVVLLESAMDMVDSKLAAEEVAEEISDEMLVWGRL